ncbi:FeS-binding protein [Desulfovibrio intestinalis]|uniref:Magnesium-transporting ATPase (P-type) n=1 Tax=Desulfovibrio intestinalis TaxID=58621 RepID=A0A7W8FG53_9BACT|nr:FeS-binding protein [Desulfovibrio intestinalis]MBB5143390.1 magnesium-transporting ATPase (P-type) [Desulfovibrio intestinalis]
MMRSQRTPTRLFSGTFCALWTIALLTATLSGLAHLPVAVRYSLINIDNQATVWHYYAVALLLMLETYAVIIWWVQGRGMFSFTRCGAIRTALLATLSVTGLILMLHNLPDVAVFGRAYTTVKLCHLFSGLLLVPILLVQCCLWLAGKPSALKICASKKNRSSL